MPNIHFPKTQKYNVAATYKRLKYSMSKIKVNSLRSKYFTQNFQLYVNDHQIIHIASKFHLISICTAERRPAKNGHLSSGLIVFAYNLLFWTRKIHTQRSTPFKLFKKVNTMDLLERLNERNWNYNDLEQFEWTVIFT